MQRKVHLCPPKEANANEKILLLEKCVYGLADAYLKWYEKVKKTLNEYEGTESKVFYWHDSNGLAGIKLAVHVDAFLSFKYLELDLSHAYDKIILSQTVCVEVLNTSIN